MNKETMKTYEINMPDTCKFMGQAKDYLKENLPFTGHYILSKGLTGCGGTTMFIEDPEDVIILSPRRKMIENKCQQHKDLFYLKKSKTVT